MAELRATPYANPLTGLTNDAIQGLLAFMQDKRRTQQLQGLGNLLESTGIPKTVERAAYAESPRGLLNALTNVNRANVPFLKPETAEAAMTLAPIAAPVNRALMQATKGLPVGATIKNVGKDLSAIQIGDRTIPVTINRIDKKSGGELVNVNPTAFDEAFSKTSWQYVGEKGKEGISGRYEKFENFLKDAKSIEASNVSVSKDGAVVFGDGRHRYAVLRDMGLDELPIVMDKESIKNAKKFGYLADTKVAPKNAAEYPLAPAGTRYEEFGGELTYMTPDEYLSRVRPLTLDEESLDNIAALKSHVQSGGQLDPLHIYKSGVEDGRHRAYMAKELGIEKIPVALHTEANNLGQNIPLDALSLLAEQQRKQITGLLE
jgi:hypothetical protein